MTETESTESLEERVVAMGDQGLDRLEITNALGSNPEELAAYEAAHPEFAYAMERAETAARAWLCRRIREELMARWDWGLWLALMQWQFPDRYGVQAKEAPAPRAPNWRRWRPGIGFA